MKELRQWVCWRAEERNGKQTKVPYSPASGSHARSDDSASWGTIAEAREAARREGCNGIGFVFTADDPFCGVDLDRCVDPDSGEIEPWASEVLDELDSYAEISPSGIGLHFIVRATLPEGRRRNGRVEMYDRGRFFTVAGDHLPGTPGDIEDRQEQIDALHARLFPRESPAKNGNAPSNSPTDAEVQRRAMSAANGARFAALWAGDRSGYASDSEADLTLCSMLAFWVGTDEGRTASLFTRSGLMREKWNREDYRRRTIARALAGPEFYSPGKNGAEVQGDEPTGSIDLTGRNFVSTSLPEAAEFSMDAMPTACRTLIHESEKALGCAPELVALPMLAVLSSAIGTSHIIEVKCGWREWAALLLAVVASPGAMKTPAAKVAKKPAFECQRRLVSRTPKRKRSGSARSGNGRSRREMRSKPRSPLPRSPSDASDPRRATTQSKFSTSGRPPPRERSCAKDVSYAWRSLA